MEPASHTQFSPRRVCEDAIVMLRPLAEAKGLRLLPEIPEYLPGRVAGDSSGLLQVLVDLLAKAIDAADAGDIRFQVGIEEAEAGSLIFHCEIEGAGARLAMPAYLSDRIGSTSGSEFRPGKGNRVWFTSRLGAVAALPQGRAALHDGGSKLGESSAEGSRGRILVCEDNPMNQKVIRLMLEHLGFASDLARDGEEALAALGKGTCYEAVFMDCQMPVMDGYEATRRIRSTPGLKANVVIAMTAHAMIGDREKCLAAGMDDYISKPLSFDGLAVLLEKWTGQIGGKQNA